MALPRFVLVQQSFPSHEIKDIPAHIKRQLSQADFVSRVPKGARIAVGVGSRGIANISTICKAVVDFWKDHGARPFIIPVMGSHGAATAEGQADLLMSYGVHEATIGAPVISTLEVESIGKTAEGIEVFIDKSGYDSDGIFLLPRVKWHTDFAGKLESGMFKMMAIGLGKFAGAQQYHAFAYRLGLEQVIRSAGSKVFETGKVLGGLAIQEGPHHETAGLAPLSFSQGLAATIAHEEKLLAEVKSWAARLPVDEVDVLIVDEIGKNISGAGMDTKVINRSVIGEYNPWPKTPKVHRVYARGLTKLSHHSAVGLGMADVVHDRLVNDVDWKPTYINSLTATTPAAVRTPIHFASDRECLMRIATTAGKTDVSQVTFCRIQNTMELIHLAVSENLVPALAPAASVVSEPFDIQYNSAGDLIDFDQLAQGSGAIREAVRR